MGRRILVAVSAVIAALIAAIAVFFVLGRGAPDDTSEKDFCANFKAVSKDLSGLGANPKDSEIVKAVKDAGKKIEDTGTPKGISDDARKGFEIETKLIDDLDPSATEEDLSKMDSQLSATEKKQVQAFDKYVSDTCKM